jgi:adenylosuccinate synthase
MKDVTDNEQRAVMNINSDVVFGLQYGDEGKGKITKYIQENPPENESYTHVVRWNGGPNAGHTVFIEGKKFVTHHIPFPYNKETISIIGPGCVINPETFLKEVDEVVSMGVDRDRIKVAYNAHLITHAHLSKDGKDTAIGTTKRGIGPCYSDKALRGNYLRAETYPDLDEFVCDPTELLNQKNNKILFEGAQGFYLDVDHGDYPYVTSSSVLPCSAFTAGVTPRSLRHITGVCKAYETYVGSKNFEMARNYTDEDFSNFEKIRNMGEEFGATTGRPRKIRYLDLDELLTAIVVSGTSTVVMNKIDILSRLNLFKLHCENMLVEFKTLNDFKGFISEFLHKKTNIKKIVYSGNPGGL